SILTSILSCDDSCTRSYTLHIPFFFFYCSRPHRDLHSFPTRRSSDLADFEGERRALEAAPEVDREGGGVLPEVREQVESGVAEPDRKSTRLNSSHVSISYAVFCLKKKKKNTTTTNARV